MPYAAEHTLQIDRAADNALYLYVVGGDGSSIDVSTATCYGDIREVETKKRAAALTCTATGSPTNEITIELSGTDSLVLNPELDYEWDIFMVLSGTKTKLLYGDVHVIDNATTGSPIE